MNTNEYWNAKHVLAFVLYQYYVDIRFDPLGSTFCSLHYEYTHVRLMHSHEFVCLNDSYLSTRPLLNS